MRGVLFVFLAICLCTAPGRGAPLTCDNPLVSVTAEDATLARRICGIATAAEARFRRCGIHRLEVALKINVVGQLSLDGYGQYHRKKQQIDVLAPLDMARLRAPQGPFAFLPPETFFSSIVVHELAHASFNRVPCPGKSCVATAEYVAYAMQIQSLSVAEQEVFSQGLAPGRRISDEEISAAVYAVDPDLFAQRVWRHFQQGDDPCAIIGQIATGARYFDEDQP